MACAVLIATRGRAHDALLDACLAVSKEDILREELFELLSQSGAWMERLIDLKIRLGCRHENRHRTLARSSDISA